ncbi:hypothetical protein METP3_02262 [Methanosarcinales archaeon]|nr:hypothetical protein METP3_02262 [Methanosarcinales archaeon]
MDIHYSAKLERFANQHLKNYLEPSSHHILIERARSLRSQLQKGEWKFLIPRDHPLTFKKNKSDLQIDISCKIEGIGSDILKHNVELQIKSTKEVNSEPIINFHIDRKIPKKQEPWNHLHIGENDEPRFPFPPMDIILLCEFILINYFPKDSEKLRKDSGWKEFVIYSQNTFQKEYFQQCRNCIENNNDITLMEHLLNYP